MNWIEIAGLVLGGTSLLSVLAFFIFFKQRAAKENLSVKEKDIQVTDAAMDVVTKAEEILGKKYERIGILEKTQEEQSRIILQHERKISQMYVIIQRQVVKRQYAERLLCTLEECSMRTPPLGTFTTDDEECQDCDLLNYVKSK